MRSRFFISIVFLAGALLAVSCHSSTVKISGRIVGSDCRMIYLEQVTPLAQTLIDSAQLDETGNYKLELCDVDRTPALYNLVCNGDKIPLFLQGGDRLTVSSVGRVVHNYTVEGSEESELLRRFYQPFVAGMQRLDALSSSPETYRRFDGSSLNIGPNTAGLNANRSSSSSSISLPWPGYMPCTSGFRAKLTFSTSTEM